MLDILYTSYLAMSDFAPRFFSFEIRSSVQKPLTSLPWTNYVIIIIYSPFLIHPGVQYYIMHYLYVSFIDTFICGACCSKKMYFFLNCQILDMYKYIDVFDNDNYFIQGDSKILIILLNYMKLIYVHVLIHYLLMFLIKT